LFLVSFLGRKEVKEAGIGYIGREDSPEWIQSSVPISIAIFQSGSMDRPW